MSSFKTRVQTVTNLTKHDLQKQTPYEQSWHWKYRDNPEIYIGGIASELNEGDIILEDVLGELNGQCGECYITVHTTAGPAGIRFMIDNNDVWVREANIVISTSDVTKTLLFESQSNDVN